MIKNKQYSYYFYYCFLFAIFFIFFSQVHPLLPFDNDDWKYAGLARVPYPTFSTWNPTKILPECLQPLAGMIAAYIVSPILGDYITALVITHSIVISLFIIIYFYSIQKLLSWKFNISPYSGFCIISVLILLHFIVLKTRPSNNDHLFYSPDVNCYYNYIVPNMLCASVTMWLMRYDFKDIKSNTIRCGFCFMTFLALFSNLFSTIILSAFIGAKLLLELFECNKKECGWLKKYIKNNTYFLIIIFIWLIVQLFEANGSRASAYGAMLLPFSESLKLAIDFFVSSYYNKWFLAFTIFVILGAKTYNYFKEKHKIYHIGKLSSITVLALFLTIIYLILLSSQVFPQYLLRSEVMFTYFFFYLLIVALCLGYLTSKINIIKIFYPFLIFFFFFLLNINENTFIDLQYPYGTNIQTCEKFDRDVINQVKTADLLGKDSVIIYVHNYNNNSNWPLILNQGKYVGKTLYKHGIIKRNIVTIFELKPAEFDTKKE